MKRPLKILTDGSGKRRVLIVERNDGLFGYEEELQIQAYDDEFAKRLNDYSTAWIPVTRGKSLFETFEAAERDARLSFSWIADNAE
jgi:hypothetical protein